MVPRRLERTEALRSRRTHRAPQRGSWVAWSAEVLRSTGPRTGACARESRGGSPSADGPRTTCASARLLCVSSVTRRVSVVDIGRWDPFDASGGPRADQTTADRGARCVRVTGGDVPVPRRVQIPDAFLAPSARTAPASVSLGRSSSAWNAVSSSWRTGGARRRVQRLDMKLEVLPSSAPRAEPGVHRVWWPPRSRGPTRWRLATSQAAGRRRWWARAHSGGTAFW